MAEGEVGAVAPVVNTPVAADIATPAPDTTADQVATPEPEAKPERTFSQKELDEIVQKRLAKESRRAEKLAEERVRREMAERELERLRAEREPKPQSQGEPKQEDFKDWESYNRAVARWEAKQEAKQLLDEYLAAQRRETADEREQQTARTVREKLSQGAEKYADFQEVALDRYLPVSDAMAAAIVKTKAPADVLYHLGQNREEAERIASLEPVEQVWEIKNLEAKLTAPPVTTKTPPPIVPNGSKATAETGYRPDMSPAQFREWRKRQIAQRR